MNPEREITKLYEDPLDLIWTKTAHILGMKVVRSPEVFAAWDGQDTLTIGRQEDLDPDDSLAQMIFHEICHSLIQGEAAWKQENWGLNNTDGRDDIREHACIRLQAALAGAYGLREFFAITTDWRVYQDALPEDPLSGHDDPALPLAQQAHVRATNGPWSATLVNALEATQSIVATTSRFASRDSLFKTISYGA
jgi:hypothetical protein